MAPEAADWASPVKSAEDVVPLPDRVAELVVIV